jgi:hypothetical protein
MNDENDPTIALIYEIRSVSKASGRNINGWSEYVERPPKSNWAENDKTKRETRNFHELVYGTDLDASEVRAYEFEYESWHRDTAVGLSIDDPRGSDALISVKPLISRDARLNHSVSNW